MLAIAAVDEQTASEAIEAIQIDYEALPFCLDPLDSLRPGGPNARLDGNTMVGRELATIKWTETELAELAAGRLPMSGEFAAEWAVGDVDEAIDRKPKGHDFIIDRDNGGPAVTRHMSVTGG